MDRRDGTGPAESFGSDGKDRWSAGERRRQKGRRMPPDVDGFAVLPIATHRADCRQHRTVFNDHLERRCWNWQWLDRVARILFAEHEPFPCVYQRQMVHQSAEEDAQDRHYGHRAER